MAEEKAGRKFRCKACGHTFTVPADEECEEVQETLEPKELNPSIMQPAETGWHYEINGKRVGPVDASKLRELVATGELSAQSFIWHKGMPEWTPLAETEFAQNIQGPPPLTGQAVNNNWIWTLACAPLFGHLIEKLYSETFNSPISELWWISLVLNLLLVSLDYKALTAAGYKDIGVGYMFLIPVYMYKRAEMLKQSKAYFVVWCILFGILILGATS